jgi:hypothetical protein
MAVMAVSNQLASPYFVMETNRRVNLGLRKKKPGAEAPGWK